MADAVILAQPATATINLRLGGSAGVSGTLTNDKRVIQGDGAGRIEESQLSNAVTGGVLSFTATLTANRSLTLPDANVTITGGGTLALGTYTLTVPATGTAALLGTANVFTANQTVNGGTMTASAGFIVGNETMDVYRESITFTPTLKGSSTAGSHTYGIQFGRYQRVGNMIHAQIGIEISSKDGTMAGTVSIDGLPVPSVNAANVYQSVCVGQVSQVAYGDMFTARINPNSSEILLLKHTSGTANSAALVDSADIGSTPTIFLFVSYEV